MEESLRDLLELAEAHDREVPRAAAAYEAFLLNPSIAPASGTSYVSLSFSSWRAALFIWLFP
jgi:hypothetical protein